MKFEVTGRRKYLLKYENGKIKPGLEIIGILA